MVRAQVQREVIAEKALLIMVDAPEGAKIIKSASLQADGLRSDLELAIVKSPNAPSFVVEKRPATSSENALQAELGQTYNRISMEEALQKVTNAEAIASARKAEAESKAWTREPQWTNFQKSDPVMDLYNSFHEKLQSLKEALQQLTNDQVSSISPVVEPKTLADAVAHLENPEARATVLGHIAAAQNHRDEAVQQQQV